MKILNSFFYVFSFVLLVSLITGCGSSGSDGGVTTTNTYSTTSNKGDYSEWTFTGNQLAAVWEVITDTGAIDYTYTIAATCTTPDADNLRSCTIDTASCADGVSVCSSTPTGSFDMMEVPGVAIFVHTSAATGGDDLQVGFAKDGNACSQDVSGDYTFIRAGLGLDENFGMFRSDANFLSISHSEFGFDAPGQTVTPSVAYRTGSDGADMLGDAGCVSGVRTRTAGTETFRAMMTDSGVFVLDLPAGQGGMLSFNVANAATLADFANKSFGGISFPDNNPAESLRATSAALVANKVGLNAVIGGVSISGLSLMGLNTVDDVTSGAPAYPDFSVTPGTYASSGNVLASTYATPANIPGLFKMGGLTDKGRVVMAGMKFNGKVIGIGMVYNYRTTADVNPSTGSTFTSAGLYNTGNFILFEK